LLYGGGALLEVKLLPATLATLLATLSLFFCLWSIDRPTTLRRGIVRGLAGGALGGAALCKPDLLLVLPLAAAGSWLFQRGSLRSNLVVSGACVLGCCAAVFPAALHNLGAGEFVPISSQGGITFFQGNNPRAEGTFSLPEGFSGNKATQQAVLAGDTLLKMWQARSHWSWTLPRMAGLLLAATLTFVPARSAVAFQASAQWYLYGNEALRRRDYQRAIGFYERALEVRRRTPNIEFNLAQAYAQTGQFTKAAQHMERVLAMTPDDNAARELFVLYSRKD
jgi:tetratricopeptide (TPR) repeat protein